MMNRPARTLAIALACLACAGHASQADVCPGGPPYAYCDPWTMATYMTGPDPEVALPVWNPCDLDCDRAIDLWDVAIWQRDASTRQRSEQCCDPVTMADSMTGPHPDETLSEWNPCENCVLACDLVIDLRDVAIWQTMEARCWDDE